jgi:4-amino-4-deoxy-L-arabinose transferase-like glycosyltransferase
MSYRNRVYLALLMLTLIVRALSFHISVINPDEDAFILAARELLHGNLPYLTFFDDKPVGASALLAMVFRLFGATLLTVRLFGAFCVFLAAICIYESGRRLLVDPHRTSPVPLGAAILFIAFSNTLSGLATMTEVMLAPFTCAAVTCLALYLTQPGLSKSQPSSSWPGSALASRSGSRPCRWCQRPAWGSSPSPPRLPCAKPPWSG